jgi:hypothetical protein
LADDAKGRGYYAHQTKFFIAAKAICFAIFVQVFLDTPAG